MGATRLYILYDGRAEFEGTENASVQVTADSLAEAEEYAGEFGDSVCYSYDQSGEALTDERWEFSYDTLNQTIWGRGNKE